MRKLLKKWLLTFTKLKLNTGRRGKVFFLSKAIRSSMVDVKASRQILWEFNPRPNQVMGIRIPRNNGQDQIVRSRYYCCSYIRVDSIDESKNTTIERLQWLTLKSIVQTPLLFTRVKKKQHVLLRLDRLAQCLKNQLQSSN